MTLSAALEPTTARDFEPRRTFPKKKIKWPNTLSREFTNIYFTQLDVAISEPDMYIALTIVVSPLSWA